MSMPTCPADHLSRAARRNSAHRHVEELPAQTRHMSKLLAWPCYLPPTFRPGLGPPPDPSPE
eukprot:11106642-Alexandrium_andersonii.AAC.1